MRLGGWPRLHSLQERRNLHGLVEDRLGHGCRDEEGVGICVSLKRNVFELNDRFQDYHSHKRQRWVYVFSLLRKQFYLFSSVSVTAYPNVRGLGTNPAQIQFSLFPSPVCTAGHYNLQAGFGEM